MSMLDSAVNWFKSVYDSGLNTAGEWSQEWQNSVDSFRTKAKAFMAEYAELQSLGQYADATPELRTAYDSLMSKGQWLYNAIANVASKIDMMGGGSTMGAMGALPLVPLAVISGALAAITAWLSDAYIMKQKLNVAREALSQGHTPGNIADMINGGSLISVKGSTFQTLLLLGTVGAAVYFFSKKVRI